LRSGIDSALMGLGKASIRDLTPDDILVPPGFTRALGAEPDPRDSPRRPRGRRGGRGVAGEAQVISEGAELRKLAKETTRRCSDPRFPGLTMPPSNLAYACLRRPAR